MEIIRTFLLLSLEFGVAHDHIPGGQGEFEITDIRFISDDVFG
jgi:hypothetical protein